MSLFSNMNPRHTQQRAPQLSPLGARRAGLRAPRNAPREEPPMRPYECRKVPALRYLLKLSPELTLNSSMRKHRVHSVQRALCTADCMSACTLHCSEGLLKIARLQLIQTPHSSFSLKPPPLSLCLSLCVRIRWPAYYTQA